MPPSESGETPKYNLPPPVSETGAESDGQNTEKSVEAPEVKGKSSRPKLSNQTTPKISLNLPDDLQSPTAPVANPTSISGTPMVAADQDLIEKEWVAKAKRIIEENREDPHNQSKEITLFKADYMNKRYNKVLKVSE